MTNIFIFSAFIDHDLELTVMTTRRDGLQVRIQSTTLRHRDGTLFTQYLKYIKNEKTAMRKVNTFLKESGLPTITEWPYTDRGENTRVEA